MRGKRYKFYSHDPFAARGVPSWVVDLLRAIFGEKLEELMERYGAVDVEEAPRRR